LRKKKTDERQAYLNNFKIFLFSIPGTPGPLYTILPEKKVGRLGRDIMGSTHVYEMSKKDNSESVEVSLDPENLDISDQQNLEQKYDEQLRKKAHSRAVEREDEDLSDMVKEHIDSQSVCLINL
jgi:hypothetical protein